MLITHYRKPPNYDRDKASMGGLGELAGATGIDFIDQNLSAIKTQIDDAVFATKMTMYFSIAAGLASVLLLVRTGRKF